MQKLQSNMYTNAANTYNMNTLYPNFNTMPGTGGFIDIVDYNKFNQDPNYVSPGDATSQYADWRRDMILEGIPPDNIPNFIDWNKTFNGQTTNTDKDAVINSGYDNIARSGKELRLAKKRMALADFLKRTGR